ncbi:MAG: hypothetical protein NVSMB38_05880 [Ktedonobacteraceae bacterium]
MAGLEGRILDCYELRQLAGRGGMADVYRGFDTRFQRDIAVKVFKREDEELLRRFVREARLMASLHNPHLMPVFDTGMDEVDGIPHYYIVMPFMEGGTLRSRIRRDPIPLADACRYLREIADALDYIHLQGIIHRDIKSSNVLLDADGNSYLSDFGIARTTSDATQLTSTGNVLGTVDYVAPELFEPNRRADARSDLYSLGILVFEMVTGQLPFSAENQIAVVNMHMNRRPPLPSSISQNISPQVERVILRGLEKNPDLRYASATEFADAFCQAVSTQGRVNMVGDVATPVRQDASAQNIPLVLPRVTPMAPPSTRGTTRIVNEPLYVPPASRSTQTFRPQPSPLRTRARIVTVLALVVLLAVIGPIIYVLLGNAIPGVGSASGTGGHTQTATTIGSTISPTAGKSPAAMPNQTATAQAFANATQQAQHATATAIAGATVTAQAHATATAGVIQTATTGNALYKDTLNNADNPDTQNAQWDTNSNCTFTADGYRITKGTSLLNEGQLQGCLEKGNKYGNMALSVDMSIIGGHSGGVFFRVSTKTLGAYAGYLFEVDNTGRYKISKSSNFSTGTGDVTLQEWTPSSALKVSAKNTLQYIASGNNLSFYANGVFLTTLQDKDSSFTYGDIALLATTATGGEDANIVYTNLSVYGLS